MAWQAAQEAFDFLGVSSHNALHFREGTHAHNEEDWTALADFCDLIFFSKEPKTRFNEKKIPV